MNASTLDGTVGAAASVRMVGDVARAKDGTITQDGIARVFAERLRRRLGVSIEVAALVAELAFRTEVRR